MLQAKKTSKDWDAQLIIIVSTGLVFGSASELHLEAQAVLD